MLIHILDELYKKRVVFNWTAFLFYCWDSGELTNPSPYWTADLKTVRGNFCQSVQVAWRLSFSTFIHHYFCRIMAEANSVDWWGNERSGWRLLSNSLETSPKSLAISWEDPSWVRNLAEEEQHILSNAHILLGMWESCQWLGVIGDDGFRRVLRFPLVICQKKWQ